MRAFLVRHDWLRHFCMSMMLIFGGKALADGQGVCGGRPLPYDQDRQWSNHILVCGQSVSHFLREPVWLEGDKLKEWTRLNRLARATQSIDHRRKMQEIGQTLPEIKWSGHVNYDTYEEWDWVESVLGPHPDCGFEEVETTYTDSNGEEKTTKTQIMKTCWHDESRHESRYCSTESMSYQSKFVRPSVIAWGPDAPKKGQFGYFDQLPNAYDLIPGESEDIQFFNTSVNLLLPQTEMYPKTEVGGAWNDYEIRVSPASFSCVFGGGNYHADVEIHTNGRIKKQSPNSFRSPVKKSGEEIEAVAWSQIDGVKSRPNLIKLSDASAVTLATMARNAQSFGKSKEIAVAEGRKSLDEQGLDNDEERAERNAKIFNGGEDEGQGFIHDVNLRLRLIKVMSWARDVRVTANLYGRGADLSVGAYREHYQVPLDNFWEASGPVFADFWKKFSAQVQPGGKYEFRISMFQKGVPFYYQPEDFTFQYENRWFSNELVVGFDVPKDAVDIRDGTQKLAEYYQKPFYEKTPTQFFKAWWSFLTE